MDFAAQLAKLEQSANAARRSNPRPRQRPRLHPPDSHPLSRLERLGMRFDTNSTTTPLLERDSRPKRPPHICFLAITIDDMPYLDIWKAFWQDANCFVSLVCHAKFPSNVTSDVLKNHIILEPPKLGRGNTWDHPVYRTHTPNWGSIEIVRAMQDVLSQGLQIGAASAAPTDHWPEHQRVGRYVVHRPKTTTTNTVDGTVDTVVPPVDKFVYVSETCLPVQSIQNVQMALFGETVVATNDMKNKEPSNNETTTTTTTTDSKPAAVDDSNSDSKEDSNNHAARDNASTDTTRASISNQTDDNSNAGTTKETTLENKDEPSATKQQPSQQVDIWDVSWVNARNQNMDGTPRNLYEREQFAKIRNIAGIYRWKADQWMVLSRLHAQAIHHIDCHLPVARQLWRSFNFINAADEMYFPTALAMLGYLKQEDDSSTTIAKRPVTYTNWTEGMKNPKSHVARELEQVIKVSREQGSLFARKFEGPITVDEWKRAMQQQ